jgi:single-stranded-DNA-specific exonuclease
MQAMEIVDGMQLSGSVSHGLCLYDEDWHQGIVGLVAGRIKDRTGKPVIAFAKAGDEELKGSARSVAGLHIRDILSDISTKHPGLVVRFGGHAAAAGLSLRTEDLAKFESAFSDEVEARSDSDLGHVVYSDGSLAEEELSLDFAGLLRRSGPWGQQFPEPLFDDEFDVLESRTVGNDHLKLRVRKKGGTRVMDAISFYHEGTSDHAAMEEGVRMVYKLDINEYQGLRKPQLIVQHLLLP